MSVKEDSRNIDNSVAIISGEGAGQAIGEYNGHPKHEQLEPWHRVPTLRRGDVTYYDRPLLKAPVWKIDIPLYYYLGGAAGAALALGAATQLARDRRFNDFIRRCHWIGIIGSTAGGALLVHDLGRPSRFLNMMRVFRPTSPMNMGAWILAGAAPLGILTGMFTRSRPGILASVGEVTGYGAGLFGLALAGYTGVLVGNTAVPVWQQSRRILPLLFFASAISSAASLLELTYHESRANKIVTSFGRAGRILELAAAHAMEREAARVPRVAKPLREGLSGVLWKSATLLTAASLVVSLLPPSSKAKRRTAGILGTLGAVCLRMAIHQAGSASASDPRASFQQQRFNGRAITEGRQPSAASLQSGESSLPTSHLPARS